MCRHSRSPWRRAARRSYSFFLSGTARRQQQDHRFSLRWRKLQVEAVGIAGTFVLVLLTRWYGEAQSKSPRVSPDCRVLRASVQCDHPGLPAEEAVARPVVQGSAVEKSVTASGGLAKDLWVAATYPGGLPDKRQHMPSEHFLCSVAVPQPSAPQRSPPPASLAYQANRRRCRPRVNRNSASKQVRISNLASSIEASEEDQRGAGRSLKEVRDRRIRDQASKRADQHAEHCQVRIGLPDAGLRSVYGPRRGHLKNQRPPFGVTSLSRNVSRRSQGDPAPAGQTTGSKCPTVSVWQGCRRYRACRRDRQRHHPSALRARRASSPSVASVKYCRQRTGDRQQARRRVPVPAASRPPRLWLGRHLLPVRRRRAYPVGRRGGHADHAGRAVRRLRLLPAQGQSALQFDENLDVGSDTLTGVGDRDYQVPCVLTFIDLRSHK